MDCECEVIHGQYGPEIIQCPMHAAAEELGAALGRLLDDIAHSADCPQCIVYLDCEQGTVEDAKSALAKANEVQDAD